MWFFVCFLNQCLTADQTNYRRRIHLDKTYLKFLLVKRLKEMLRNKFIKTFLQCQELCFYSSHEPPVHVQPVGEEEKVRGDELDSTGIFTADLASAHFTEDLVFNKHILYYERSAYPFLFPSTMNYCTINRKSKELHLLRSSCGNLHVIYDSGVPTQNTSLVSLYTKILFTALFPLHLQDIFLFAVPDIFLLVLFCHWNIPAIWFEFML